MSKESGRKESAMHRLLADPEKQIHMTYGSHGALAKFWRRMLMDLGINGFRFSVLMDRYLRDPNNHVPNNKSDRTSNRGNFNKEFSHPQMSWKVFCKGMKFLLIESMEITIKAKHHDGKITEHHLFVPLDSDTAEMEIDEADKSDHEPAMDQEEITYLDYRSEFKPTEDDKS